MSALALTIDSDRFDVQLAIGGFLAGYSGNTRLAYQQDLRCYVTWCWNHNLAVFTARRTHIELFARSLELAGAARATTARRLSTVASFYRYCTEEEFIASNPAVNVRRPRLRHEATIHGLDRNELGAFLVQAGLSGARDHALACLLALNGLRVSEALNCDAGDLGLERGHHTLRVHRKGGRTVIVPLAPALPGPCASLSVNATKATSLLTLDVSGWIVTKRYASCDVWPSVQACISPHSLRHSFITAALDAGVPLGDVQEAASHADPRTTMRYDRARRSLDRHATYIVATFVAGASRWPTYMCRYGRPCRALRACSDSVL